MSKAHKEFKNPELEVNLAEEVEITVASVINQLLFGFSYSNSEERQKFVVLKNMLSEHMIKAMSPALSFISTVSSLLRFVPPFKKVFEGYESEYKFFINYFETQIQNHLQNLDEDEDTKDFTDAYLKEILRKKPGYNEKQLKHILYDFWIAGQETTSNTIIFGILYAIHFPETQKKVHQELDEKINSSRRISLADKNDLQYTQAFVNEVQRFVNLLPMNLFRTTTKNVSIRNFEIPEGTCVIPQISNVLYDENVFKNPMDFDPERFLDEDKKLKKIDEFIPFSVGKRQCLGESLAKMELFLILSNLFNQFEIKPVSEHNLPSLKKRVGVTVQPEKFTCVIEKRFK
ncbi:hypothetical protein FO519_006312 [Halicephalobus sp. NKZ332]|nr:hypothetical protein FO519_006312 [Halicephalobus sp. NKZ332]